MRAWMILLLLASLTLAKVSQKDNSWKYMVFTQYWAAASCMEFQKEHRSCNLTDSLDKWTIHGIWPNNEDKTGPFFCDETWKFNEESISDIESELDKRWPNIISDSPHTQFWKHEWEKHGTCAASLDALNSEHKYFSKGLELNTVWNLSEILEAFGIRPSNDQGHELQDIKNAIEAVSKSFSNIGCVNVHGYQLLVQVEICLDKQFNAIDCVEDDKDRYANKRGKLVWRPASRGVYPCSSHEPVYYVSI